jgi:RNA polymerase sigma factor (sigma-70 family)
MFVRPARRLAGREASARASPNVGSATNHAPALVPRTPAEGPDGHALALLAAGEVTFRRTARRYSICLDDAEDAFQRAVEILLTKAPDRRPSELAAWMHVVTRREALAVRRSRERLLATSGPEHDRVELLACARPDPAEQAERRERVEAAAQALAALKRDERLAIVLQAHGYSYAEIGELCGWTYTKVNRCLAEGRARLYRLAEASGLRS